MTETTNRLIDETSPYLLQHAHNPVDWYPWGEDAFEVAAREDKPVFLSVGYSACHWCHVMEHESFENPQIAELMNRWFVNIKVDREERPDVDQIYMSAVQLMTQRGGWPMSVFLTPEKKPFYGGTYWPPTARMGMPGFADILTRIHEIWEKRRDEVTDTGERLTDAVARMAAPEIAATALDESHLRNAMTELLKSADRTHGGFGGAPKFPHAMDLRVLLRCWKRYANDEALEVVELTLDRMSRGGIYDHLGGGFHRYSTDSRWLVPHFEKMLYDNALLVPALLELGQVIAETREAACEPWPWRVARETLDYVLREMQQPQGGFYSTQDADSEGEEGRFFVWTEAEIDDLLSSDDGRLFKYAYDVTRDGNWEGSTILNRPKLPDEAANVLGVSSDDLEMSLANSRRILFEARENRPRPGRDDKVLAAWNGWMISALAMGAQVLQSSKYADAATRAADFIMQKMRNSDGRLLHSFKDDRARFNAYLDDYAALISSLVDLYQCTFEARHLETAQELAQIMLEQFSDEAGGGFFFTSHDHEQLIARSRDAQDNATPSGNSQAAMALIQLGLLSGDLSLTQRGQETLNAMSGLISLHPRATGQALIAWDLLLGPSAEIVLVDGRTPERTDSWLRELHRRFLPRCVLMRSTPGGERAELPEILSPLAAGKSSLEGQTTAYVCQQQTCGPPLTSLEDLLAFVGATQPGS